MSFITRTDLNMAIREHEVNTITSGDSTLVEIAISTALGEMLPYLHRYDTDTIFAQQAAKRDPLLVRFAVDIAVFELCSIALPDQDLDNRTARYKRAIGWLKEVRDEKIPVALLPKPVTETGGSEAQVMYGSTPKRNNSY
jgi:phage gp36-like protein